SRSATRASSAATPPGAAVARCRGDRIANRRERMNTPHRQAARSRGQRLSVDRAGLGSTGERGRAIPDIPAVLREHPGQAGGRTQGSLGEPPEERPACVLRITGRSPAVAQVVRTYGNGVIGVRLWMGLSMMAPRRVRWSHTMRTAHESDIVRPATPREVILGHPG